MTEGPKHNNKFTAQDIERYYKGTMSSLEMHQLEKAAMEDPFLADALEGYAYTSTPVKDSEYLHSQLQLKMVTGKIVPINKLDKNQLLKIAALFILLAGCGWAIYQSVFNTRNNDIASAKKIESSTPAPSITADTVSSDVALQQPNTNANSEPNTQTTTIENDSNGTVSLSTQNRHTGKLNKSAASTQKEKDQSNEVLQSETKVVNEPGEDAPAAAKSGTQQPNIDSGNIASAPQTVSPGKENVIVLQRSKSDPIPQIVLTNTKRDSNYRRPHITYEVAEPANGSVNYNDYVANNLQIPELEIQKNISGEIRLSFDVNEAGQAINIKVEKSLCAQCDEEAIRILKQGPKWVKKKKDKKGKLSLKFE